MLGCYNPRNAESAPGDGLVTPQPEEAVGRTDITADSRAPHKESTCPSSRLTRGAESCNKGIVNYLRHKPLIVSYEVTLSCNCNCRHCDLGGLRPNEQRISPDDYARL